MLKAGGAGTVKWLTNIIQIDWESGTIPADWKKGSFFLLLKASAAKMSVKSFRNHCCLFWDGICPHTIEQ